MMCDARTCAGCRYLEKEDHEDRIISTGLAEFLANCQHAKCKMVRLVRQQISKLQNMQYERFLIRGDATTEKLSENENAITTTSSTKVYEEPFSEVHQVHRAVYEPSEYSRVNGSCGDARENEDEVVDAQVEANEGMHEEPESAVAVERTVEVKKIPSAIKTATASLPCAFPGRAVNRKWMLRILNRVCHRAHLILAAAAVGLIVWSALVYGVFLGATACGSGRTCFASSFQHAKRSLF